MGKNTSVNKYQSFLLELYTSVNEYRSFFICYSATNNLLTVCHVDIITNWGVGHVIFTTKYLEILARGRSDVAVGCSKRW
jgi:hypothetical protein